jgi:hypothetical protein
MPPSKNPLERRALRATLRRAVVAAVIGWTSMAGGYMSGGQARAVFLLMDALFSGLLILLSEADLKKKILPRGKHSTRTNE